MKKVYTAILFCFGIAISLTGCNKEVVDPMNHLTQVDQAASSSLNQQDVSVVDGHLRFRNQAVLRDILDGLRGIDKMEALEKQYSDFKSMRKSYDELVRYDVGKALTDGSINSFKGVYRIVKEADGENSYERAIFDQSLSTVLNARGVFQIGDSLYRISEQKTVVVPVRYQTELYSEQPAHGVVRAVTHRYVSQNANARLRSDHDDVTIEYHPDGLTVRRFRGIGVSTNYAFSADQHWEAGYKVWHQRHNWWGWGSEFADYIYLNCKVTVNGQLRYSPAGFPSQGAAGRADLYENEFKFTEGWTSATVGLVRVEYDWTGTGNGTQNGIKYVYNSGAKYWQENI